MRASFVVVVACAFATGCGYGSAPAVSAGAEMMVVGPAKGVVTFTPVDAGDHERLDQIKLQSGVRVRVVDPFRKVQGVDVALVRVLEGSDEGAPAYLPASSLRPLPAR